MITLSVVNKKSKLQGPMIKALLRYRRLKAALAKVEQWLIDQVMAGGESVTLVSEQGENLVRVTHSKGRATFDWRTAVEDGRIAAILADDMDLVEQYDKQIRENLTLSVKWATVAKNMGLSKAPKVKDGTPKASVKVLKG